MTEREEFEVWAQQPTPNLDCTKLILTDDEQYYEYGETRAAWLAWQAARAEPPHDAEAWRREYPLASYWKRRADKAEAALAAPAQPVAVGITEVTVRETLRHHTVTMPTSAMLYDKTVAFLYSLPASQERAQEPLARTDAEIADARLARPMFDPSAPPADGPPQVDVLAAEIARLCATVARLERERDAAITRGTNVASYVAPTTHSPNRKNDAARKEGK